MPDRDESYGASMTKSDELPKGANSMCELYEEIDKSMSAEVAGQSDARVTWQNGFAMHGDGLYDDDGRLSAPFDIVGEARDSTSQEWGLALHWKDRDGVKHSAIVLRADLIGDGTDALRKLAGGGLEICGGPARLRKFREALAGVACPQRVRLVQRTGWHGSTFVLPHRSIGESKELIIWSGSTTAAKFAEAGTLEDWKTSVASLAAGNARLMFALSLALSGPLADLIGEPGSGFHLRGASSTGKSTLLLAAGSVWGGGGPNGFVGTWRATANGLEGLAVVHSATCLILDELAEINAHEAAGAVYALAHGHGKARAGKSGEIRPRSEWRVPLLSSGEIGLSEKIAEDHAKKAKAGLDVRLVDLPADAGADLGVFNILHGRASGSALSNELRNAALSRYGVAGPTFVKELAADVEHVTEGARLKINSTERGFAGDASGQAARVARRFAVIGVAGEFAREALRLPWAPGEAIEAARQLFDVWLSERGGNGPAELLRGWEAVRDAIERHGASRFQDDRDGNQSNIRIMQRLGWRTQIHGTDCWAFSNPGWREVLAGIVDPKWIAQELLAQGFLHESSDTRGQLSKKIDGETHRLIAIPVSKLSEDFGA
jgi:putative DNA primase/helicase